VLCAKSAKRPNYDKLAVASPFLPDFYSLLSLPVPHDLTASQTRESPKEGKDAGEGKPNESNPSHKPHQPESIQEEPETETRPEMGEMIMRPYFVSRRADIHATTLQAAAPSLLCVVLRMADRGVAHFNALICLPTEDDIAHFGDRTQKAPKDQKRNGPLASLHEDVRVPSLVTRFF